MEERTEMVGWLVGGDGSECRRRKRYARLRAWLGSPRTIDLLARRAKARGQGRKHVCMGQAKWRHDSVLVRGSRFGDPSISTISTVDYPPASSTRPVSIRDLHKASRHVLRLVVAGCGWLGVWPRARYSTGQHAARGCSQLFRRTSLLLGSLEARG